MEKFVKICDEKDEVTVFENGVIEIKTEILGKSSPNIMIERLIAKLKKHFVEVKM